MLRLTHLDLPESLPNKGKGYAPILRVWSGMKRQAPIARIHYGNPSLRREEMEIPDPLVAGYFYTAMVPFEFDVIKLSGLAQIPSPLKCLPGTFWSSEQNLRIYSDREREEVDAVAIIPTLVPLGTTNFTYSITLPEAFSVIRVECLGMFVEFSQSGQILTFTSEFVQVGQKLLITGSFTLPLTPVCKIATFHFPSLISVDAFEWMGRRYAAASDAFNPRIGEYFWSRELALCTVFTPANVKAPRTLADYDSASGTLTF